ncbi:MAG: hypothetical protein LBC47_01200, partial [Tannerella sp.]|nr:hypothetical protein [Tannerella sp.]
MKCIFLFIEQRRRQSERRLSAVITAVALLACSLAASAQGNPFIKHLYTADPSARVWADGRLYVYASHDIAPPRG